ncbi:MAG: hypothetical protein ACXAC8_18215 [Candidatus Hodarchaeales archaeon]|jgi:hypothetical protein
MTKEKSFCEWCGEPRSQDDIFCASCGQRLKGKNALEGFIDLQLDQNQIFGLIVAGFVVLNILNFVFAFILLPEGMDDFFLIILVIPTLVTIIALGIIYAGINKEGSRKWFGKQINPYKKMKASERVAELLFGVFFSSIWVVILFILFFDRTIPLFTRFDTFAILVVFVPAIFGVFNSLFKGFFGNSPQTRSFLILSDFITLVGISLLLSNWFFDIPAFIEWIGTVVGENVINWIPIEYTLIEQWVQIGLWFGVFFLTLAILKHLFIMLIWMDIRLNTFNGMLANIVPFEGVEK